jgi:hypothetical protein
MVPVDRQGRGADLHRLGHGGRGMAVVRHLQLPISGAGQTNDRKMCVYRIQIYGSNPGTGSTVEKISEFLQKKLFLLAELV